MATITEDYVSFETAKLLKEKGFNEWCRAFRSPSGDLFYSSHDIKNFEDRKTIGGAMAAPTLQMAMKWLREVHGLHISLEPCYDYDSMHVIFLAFVQNVADVHEFMDGRKNVASHPNTEKSCEAAIKYCLEKLI